MFLQLQRYDFTIIHRPGKDIPVADTLSRKSLPGQDDSLSEGMDMQVHMLYNNLPVSDTRLEEIKAETDKDIQLRQLKKSVRDGLSRESFALKALLSIGTIVTNSHR